MKRLISLLAVLCLVLGCFSTAQAAKYKISQQPETQTVKKGGNVTFKVKASGVNGDTPITWYFTNPATGESTTGKKLSSVVKGVKVQNPNSLSITLKKVPETLHGWTLYCRIGPKSGAVESDTAMILISGMDVPAAGASAAASESGAEEAAASSGAEEAEAASSESTEESEPAADSEDGEGSSVASEEEEEEEEKDADTSSEAKTDSKADDSDSEAVRTVVQTVTVIATPEPQPVVITAPKLELFEMDRNGKIKGDAQTELTFPVGTQANFYVKLPDDTEGTIGYLLLDDVRLTPEGDVTGMSVRGWKSSANVRVKLKSELEADAAAAVVPPEEEEDVDESSLVTVTCTNCRFTGWHNSFSDSGKVPAGSTITVIAAGGLLKKGYSINGAKADYKNKASFSLVVEEDTTIEMTVDESWSRAVGSGSGAFSDDE